MPPAFELRPAGYDDPDAQAMTAEVQDYYVRIYGGPDRDPLTAADFSPPEGAFLIGYLAGEAVAMGGWLRYRGIPPLPAATPVQIRRMFVRERVRRQGVGQALLAGLEQSAAAAGADLILLSTGRRQPDAIALYRAAGYVDAPPFGYYSDSGGAVHLGKWLLTTGDEPGDGSPRRTARGPLP